MLQSLRAGANPHLRYKASEDSTPPVLPRPSAGFADELTEADIRDIFAADEFSDFDLAELIEREQAGVDGVFTITLPLILGDSRPCA